jgi:GNAT superfamily N-acetyltransferase
LAVTLPADGTIWVAEDDGDIVAAAMWRPPWSRTYAPDALAAHEAACAPALATDGPRLDAADALTRHAHPPAPAWYLGTVGTHPDHRRRGLAAAVVAPVLRRCDDEGIVAFLETSSDDNVRGYRRLGFEVTFETVTPDGRLPLVVMHRQPRRR